jgi:hypothetical protein
MSASGDDLAILHNSNVNFNLIQIQLWFN